MDTATAQINVKIDRKLKKAGDAALVEIGLTPSEAVRGLWRVAAARGEAVGSLRDLLRGTRTREEQEAYDARMAAVLCGPHLLADGLRELGLDMAAFTPLGDDDMERERYGHLLGEGVA